MYSIGMFSKINKVTIKTLRYYDETGLLKPAYVNEENGYRYYSSDQLLHLHKILALRQMELSVDEIRSILNGSDIEKIFESKKSKLETELKNTKKKLKLIDFYLQNIKEVFIMKYDVRIKELPACIVYSKRMRVKNYDEYFDIIPKIGEEVKAVNPDLKCSLPEYCFIIYHDGEYKEENFEVEFCEAVEKIGNETEKIKFKNMSKIVEAATVLHKGSYKTIGSAYSYIFKWIDDNGYEVFDKVRESYIDGIWNKDDENDWLTEIQIPIVKK